MTNRNTRSLGLIMISPPLADAALDAVLANAPEQVVLVEPDPTRARRLETRKGVRVINATINRTAGQGSLLRFNFPGLRSLFAPTEALYQALPGLREAGRTTVPVITPDDLAVQLDYLSEPLELYINAPGAEIAILEGLAKGGVLYRAERIHLYCGTVAMVKGAASRSTLEDWIIGHGFTLHADTSDDPDWAALEFRIDLMARAFEETRAALRVSEDAVETRQVRIAALEQELSDTRAALKQREDNLAALEQEQADTRAALKQREENLAALEQEQADTRAALKQREENLATVNSERDKLQGQLDQRTQCISDLEAAVSEARQSAQEAMSDMRLAMCMQMLAQSDLRDLQDRFREAEQARTAQQALLKKLTPRLQQAAHQLQRLQPAEAAEYADATGAIASETPSDGYASETEAGKKAVSKPKAPRKPSRKTTAR